MAGELSIALVVLGAFGDRKKSFFGKALGAGENVCGGADEAKRVEHVCKNSPQVSLMKGWGHQ